MKGNLIFKRIGAYLIDYLLIFFISSALVSISAINPRYDEYVKTSEEYNAVMEQYYEEKIDITELNEKTQELSYELNRNGYVYIIGDMVIVLLYFGLFAYVTKGQTLGKKLLGLKIVAKEEGKELKWYNYFLRTLILDGVILTAISLIALSFNKDIYYAIYNIVNNVNSIVMIVIFMMVLFYKENRGLHDVIAKTKVIDLKYNNINDEEIEIIKPQND